ncbi:MAG TPA: nucleotidyltransferase [Candidatus Thermoplasmatota archaeon]
MARERVVAQRDPEVVRYRPERFETLERKRARAAPFLHAAPPGSVVYGSVARGDVRERSDVDIEVPFGATSFAVEVALAGLPEGAHAVVLTQATPNSVVKAAWDYGDVTVTLPLTRPSGVEVGFTRFAGAMGATDLSRGRRVPGVDKRLMLIEPLPEGHRESSVADRVRECARLLALDEDVLQARIRVLGRRARTGRTGIFLTRAVNDGESPEQALARVSASNPAVRRAVGGRP